MTVLPLRIVKVSNPSLTMPIELVTVALRATDCALTLNVVAALSAAVVVEALLMVREWLLSDEPKRLDVPL